MPADPSESRSWLSDVLSRRVRRPALEETIFHQLDELERGPLERLASLVHAAIDELQEARRRLDDQARDVRSLRHALAELTARVDALAGGGADTAVEAGHVLLLATPEGYRLAEADGAPPAPGDELELAGVRWRVLNRRRSPLPGDRRACALLLRS